MKKKVDDVFKVSSDKPVEVLTKPILEYAFKFFVINPPESSYSCQLASPSNTTPKEILSDQITIMSYRGQTSNGFSMTIDNTCTYASTFVHKRSVQKCI